MRNSALIQRAPSEACPGSLRLVLLGRCSTTGSRGDLLSHGNVPGSPLLFCKTDSHWSPYACEVTARQIRKTLGNPPWLKGGPDVFKTRTETRKITGDLTDGKGYEELPVRVVTAADGAAIEDKASPVVLLGDSHTLVFHAGQELHGTGAGLADQLAAELGVVVDVIGVRGSGSGLGPVISRLAAASAGSSRARAAQTAETTVRSDSKAARPSPRASAMRR